MSIKQINGKVSPKVKTSKNFGNGMFNPKVTSTDNPVYFTPYNFSGLQKQLYHSDSPVKDSFISTVPATEYIPCNSSDEKKDIKDLMSDLDPEEKAVLTELLGKGKLTEKEAEALVKESRECETVSFGTDIPYYISNLSEHSKKALLNYIKANNLSKTDVKTILKNDQDWREIERIVGEYFVSEREDSKDFCLKMSIEMQKAQENRLKLLATFNDEMSKTYAEIHAHRMKTNQEINDIMYKAMFG